MAPRCSCRMPTHVPRRWNSRKRRYTKLLTSSGRSLMLDVRTIVGRCFGHRRRCKCGCRRSDLRRAGDGSSCFADRASWKYTLVPDSRPGGVGVWDCMPHLTKEQLQARAWRVYLMAVCNCFTSLVLAWQRSSTVVAKYKISYRVFADGEHSGAAVTPEAAAVAARDASLGGRPALASTVVGGSAGGDSGNGAKAKQRLDQIIASGQPIPSAYPAAAVLGSTVGGAVGAGGGQRASLSDAPQPAAYTGVGAEGDVELTVRYNPIPSQPTAPPTPTAPPEDGKPRTNDGEVYVGYNPSGGQAGSLL